MPIVKEDLGQGQLRITGLVEKPEPAVAPSAFAAIGGYVQLTRSWRPSTRPTVSG
ncbi:hypothetical protein GCM10010236_10170 [Streptomyces eurythermus]|nr:hypothetical protein GCM10010236_10170 [Streptomyces eurythermus]